MPTQHAPGTSSPTTSQEARGHSPMLPTYYVRHPDGTYSIAQPTQEQVAAQAADFIYALCDRKHDGSCCEDPDCYRAKLPGEQA